jgi:hypothetical protein
LPQGPPEIDTSSPPKSPQNLELRIFVKFLEKRGFTPKNFLTGSLTPQNPQSRMGSIFLRQIEIFVLRNIAIYAIII